MILSARFLSAVANVNSFEYVNQVEFIEGDAVTVYFQLIDSSLDKGSAGFSPAGRRYAPAAGATLAIVVDSIDDAKKLTRFASQPFANDPSIWSFQVSATDPVKGTANFRMTLTEGGVVRRGMVPAAFRIYPAVPV